MSDNSRSDKIDTMISVRTDLLERHGYAVEYGNMVDSIIGFISAPTKRVFVGEHKSKIDILRFLLFAEYMIRNYKKSVFANLEHALYVSDDLFCPIDEAILKDCTDYANRVFEAVRSS